MSRNINKVT